MTKKYIEDNDLRRSNLRAEGYASDALQHGESPCREPCCPKNGTELPMICGKCGKEDKDDDYNIKKVKSGKYTSTLCTTCRHMFEIEIENVDRKYLTTNLLLVADKGN